MTHLSVAEQQELLRINASAVDELARLRARCERLERALRDSLEWLYDLKGEWDWRKDEPRCGFQQEYESLCAGIDRIAALAAPEPEATRQKMLDTVREFALKENIALRARLATLEEAAKALIATYDEWEASPPDASVSEWWRKRCDAHDALRAALSGAPEPSEKDKRVAALEKMFEEAPHAPNCAEVLLPVNPNPGARCDCWKHDFLRVYAEIGRG